MPRSQSPVLLPGDPTNALHATTKQYVDAALLLKADAGAVIPAGPSPASILNIGPRLGQNHFAAQLARLGDAAFFTKTMNALATGYEEDPIFVGTPDKRWVACRVSVGAPTTAGSSFSRAELREQGEQGEDNVFDAADANTHRASGRFRIVKAPANLPDIVCVQLHNSSADRVAIRTQLVSGTWRLRIRFNGSTVTLDGGGTDIAVGIANIQGLDWDWKIEIVNGVPKVWVGLATDPNALITPKYTGSTALTSTGSSSWYFKTGCYLQTTTANDTASDYGEVWVHRSLSHWHTGWTNPAAFYATALHAPAHAPGAYDDLSAYYIPLSQKGAANGVAALVGTVLPRSYYQYANSTQDGTIVLTGDLGGTATAPTVPGLAAKANRALNVRTVTTSTTIVDSDDVILADTTSAALTLTLPTAAGISGRDFLIKKIGVNQLTIATTSSQTIDGAASEAISMTNGFRELVSDGTNWRIRGGKVDPVILTLGDVSAGGTLTINAAAATVYRSRTLGSTASLAVPTSPIDGDVVNIELYATVACTLTINSGIVPTGGLSLTVSIPAGKLWSAALRYRGTTSPATSTAAWRLLASSVDN